MDESPVMGGTVRPAALSHFAKSIFRSLEIRKALEHDHGHGTQNQLP